MGVPGTASPKSRRGFTLVELLVVVALTAILTGILYPVFAQVREKARQTVCQSNLKQLGNAFVMYAQDYDDQLPYEYHSTGAETAAPLYQWWWEDDLQPYLRSYRLFVCPSASPLVSYDFGRSQPDFRTRWPAPLFTSYLVNSAHWDSPNDPCPQFKKSGTCTPPLWENEGDETESPSLAAIEAPSGTLLVTEGWTMEVWRIEETAAWSRRPGFVQAFDTANSATLEGRHQGANNELYADGHVKAVRTLAATPAEWTREAD